MMFFRIIDSGSISFWVSGPVGRLRARSSHNSSSANLTATVAVMATLAATATRADDSDPMLLHSADGLEVRTHFQFGLNAVVEKELFWDLAGVTAPTAPFEPNTEWLEAYIKPGVSFEYALETGATLYGKLSAVASYTLGTDAFDTGDTGATTLEEAYLALRGDLANGMSYDVSLGPRELVLGTGMLVANGATSGFERGALKFGPRKAWESAAIARLSQGSLTGTAFYLDPNEMPSKDANNEIAGIDLRYAGPQGGYLGATFVEVLNSESPYPQANPGSAPPSVIDGAREGTTALNIYGKTDPFSGVLENWTFTGDVAIERNDAIDLEAWAGRVTAGYAWQELPWSPSLTYSYQTFSGDDPETPELERFDPLFYQGSPSAWATGSKSASTFINSNVNAHALTLRVQPSPMDTLTLRYAHIRANELNSPVQFGQATRVDETGSVVVGVTDAHLADDVFLEYSRIINPNTFLTSGISASFPGEGIKNVAGNDAPTWTGVFINVVFNY